MGSTSRVNKLSIIIASNNPKLAALTVSQAYNKVDGLPVEIICVCEGFHTSQIPQLPCVRYITKDIEGYAGAYAKDLGIQKATGQYVAFWDDDNYYFDNVINLDYLDGHNDIIVYQAYHLTPDKNYVIPRDNPSNNGFTIGDIDTMCFIVKTQIARKVLWSSHKGKQTDYHWIRKIKEQSTTIKYVEKIIGHKITLYG